MDNIRSYVQDKILAGSRTAPAGHYRPALVVGLGGSGLRVLRHLKKRMAESDVVRVRLLGIDSDNSENEKYPELPGLNASELAILDAGVAARSLDRAAAAHATDAHILEYLPDRFGDMKGIHQDVKGRITAQKGAGQLRRAGKLLFCTNVSDGAFLDRRIAQQRQHLAGLQVAVQRIREGYQIEPGVSVYVVTSVAGGTGAGGLLDCLALLREHFASEHDIITVVLLLPGPLLDAVLYNPKIEQGQTRGNALGVLREMQPFLVGGKRGHRFRFDDHHEYTLDNRALADDVYLVDHHTYENRQARDLMDVYRGMSYFLYSLVGSGVGATQQAGAINGNITDQHKMAQPPRVYSALGVAAAEYPLDEMLEYSVRSTLGQWLERWLAGKAGAGADKEKDDARNFTTEVRLGDLALLRDGFVPDAEQATLSQGWRVEVMREGDREFIRRAVERRENLSRDLKAWGGMIEQKAEAYLQEVIRKLDVRALAWLRDGAAPALARLKRVRSEIEDRATELRRQSEKAQGEIEAVNRKLVRQARWVNIVDFGLDKGLRTRYLSLSASAMALDVARHVDPQVARVLEKLRQRVEELERRCSALATDARALHEANCRAISEMEDAAASSCFIQALLDPQQYPAWVREKGIRVEGCGTPASFDLDSLIEVALTPVIPAYRQVISDLNATAVNGEASTIFRAMNTASAPLIRHIPTATPRGHMVAQKYAAGPFERDDDPFVLKHFEPVGDNVVHCLPTGDTHRVMCIQTFSGFSVADWAGFDVAQQYYSKTEWRYHTFPTTEGLERLRPLSQDQGIALRHFGLGLAFELIVNRGANYYQNLDYYEAEKAHYYLLYKADPNLCAAKLMAMDPKLIRPAPREQTRPSKQFLLGDSLEKAFETFGQPKSAPFMKLLTDLIDDYVARAGKREIREVIESYINKELSEMISAATKETRRKLLEDVRDDLRAYVNELANA